MKEKFFENPEKEIKKATENGQEGEKVVPLSEKDFEKE